MITIFGIGVAVGLLVSLFIGPMSIVCIRRSIAEGFLIGLASGIGISCADVLYGGIAAFGLTIIADFLVKHHLMLRALSIIYLVYLGVSLLRNNNIKPNHTLNTHMNAMHAFSSTFFLTLSNPLMIFVFTAVYALFDLSKLTVSSAATLLCGIFTGSVIWWFAIASLGSIIGKHLPNNALFLINKIAGIILIVFAVVIGISLYFVH